MLTLVRSYKYSHNSGTNTYEAMRLTIFIPRCFIACTDLGIIKRDAPYFRETVLARFSEKRISCGIIWG